MTGIAGLIVKNFWQGDDITVLSRTETVERATGGDQTVIDLRPDLLIEADGQQPIKSETTGGRRSTGRAHRYSVVSDEASLVLADVVWNNGDRDVRCIDAKGPFSIRRLEHGLRLGLHPNRRGLVVDLALARIVDDQGWSTVHKADYDDLDQAAGRDVRQDLYEVGAIDINYRRLLLGDQSNRKNYLAAVFPRESTDGPLVAYLLTRVLPLLRATRDDGR